MEADKLREQFMDYVERMRKVRLLSTPSLEDVSVAEDYSSLLLSNFKEIGYYAGKNREMLDEILFPLLHEDHPLTKEETEKLNDLNWMLANGALATEIDLHLSELISDFLFREEEKLLPTQKRNRDDIEEWIRLLERRVDSLDAATDGVGRSYRAGKTLDDFKIELEETAGKRYAPYMVDLFNDTATYEDLVYLLEHGRKGMYNETYYKLKELLQK